MSLDCFEAARKLFEAGHLRSAVSRAYYAVYCAITNELAARKVKFPRGWKNPGHEQLGELVLHNLNFSIRVRRALNKAVRRLRQAREDADYRPGVSLQRSDALILIRDAVVVARKMGVEQDA